MFTQENHIQQLNQRTRSKCLFWIRLLDYYQIPWSAKTATELSKYMLDVMRLDVFSKDAVVIRLMKEQAEDEVYDDKEKLTPSQAEFFNQDIGLL